MSAPPSSTPPRAISGAPPVFPDWMRRLDPILAAEDTNAIYQAFRARRVDHSRRWRLQMPAASPGYIAVLLFGTIISVWLFLSTCILGLIAAIITAAILQVSFAKSKNLRMHIPRWLGAVFSTGGYLEHAAIDVWLSGTTGRDVTEALYLEQRERMRHAHFIAGWAALLLFGVAPIVSVAWSFVSVHGALITLACALFCAHQLLLYSYVTEAGRFVRTHIERLTGAWTNDVTVGRAAKKALGRGCGIMLAFTLLFFLIALCVGGITEFHTRMSLEFQDSPVGLYIVKHSWLYLLDLVLLIFGQVWRAGRPAKIEEHNTTVNRVLARSDYAWSTFMASTVIGDPDGAAWTSWLYLGPPRPWNAATIGRAEPIAAVPPEPPQTPKPKPPEAWS